MNAFIEKPATEDILRDTVIKLVAVSLLSEPESK
jgi:hypothetical protein